MNRFAVAAGAFVVVVTATTIALARQVTAPARLRGARHQITDAAALKKRLASIRRGYSEMARQDGRSGVDVVFRKLKEKVDDAERDSQGFFPEAEALNDAARQALFTARDLAYEEVTVRRESQISQLTREIHETKRRRPR